MFEVLHHLSIATLRSLAACLRDGPPAQRLSAHTLQQLSGPRASDLETCLARLAGTGMRGQQLALVVEAIISARERVPDPHQLADLVLSGPDVPGIPTADTAAVTRSLFEEATSEVLLVGYVVRNGEQLFAPLAKRMSVLPSLKVTFCLDIPRLYTDTSLSSEIVHRFTQDFRTKHWPWPNPPQLYYDPRSLDEATAERSSLHAKCLVIDRRTALVTSANFTEAAHERNIEVGVLVRHAPFAERLMSYFEALRRSGQLVECRLE